MDHETEMIKQNIYQTRENIAENIEALEDKFKEAVDNVKSVGQKINPVYQTRQHPFVGVAGALAVGAVVGTIIGNNRASSLLYDNLDREPRETLLRRLKESSLVSRFDDEIEQVKSMAIGAGLKWGARLIKQNFPVVASSVDEVLQSALKKLGVDQNEMGRDDEKREREFSVYA